jgi:hypothetical protein
MEPSLSLKKLTFGAGCSGSNQSKSNSQIPGSQILQILGKHYFCQEPILRLLNLQQQRQRCSMLEFFLNNIFLPFKMR